MATFSAKNATVRIGASLFLEVAEWELTDSSNNPDYRSSGTAGWTGRVAGHRDVTGSFRVFIDDTSPIWTTPQALDAGTLVSDFRCYENASRWHGGPVIIDSIVPRLDIDGDAVAEMTVAFSATGAWTFNN